MYIDITPNDDRWYDLKDLPNERWKDIKNYEGLYQVSDYGRVKSFHKNKPLIRKGVKDKDGYLRYCLSKNENRKSIFGHKLVAVAFIPNPHNYCEINHKNDNSEYNKMDNRVCNLEWCNHIYNINYGNRTKKLVKSLHTQEVYKKVMNHIKDLSEKRQKHIFQYDLEHNLIKEWKSVSECTSYHNFCRDTLRKHIIKRKVLKGYYFEYSKKRGDEHAGNNI